ncbi:carboxypeptidase B-like [Arctopsyche grandis]|uniref:carboxypeptidase B-like n=1 Tax=Arctopsyche grandis TaxID=121162 RepID=UPI00406D94CD
MKVLAFLFVALFVFVYGSHEYLEGSKVYDVKPMTKKHLLVASSVEQIPGVDVWQRAHVLGRIARVLVLKESLDQFELVLKSANIPFEVVIEDPKSVIEAEIKQQKMARMNRLNGTISFTSYNRYDEINAYLDVLAEKYPTRVTVETLGTTEEGREIKVIKISSNGGNNPNKPIIVSDAGVHAREWIAPATALYMITKLVEDITERDVADNVDWFIIPLINPDGYEYTHTDDRMWRKTRTMATSTECPGVDANRNYDFKWSNIGNFSKPCSILFSGPSAFSEVESQVIRNLINDNKSRVKAYLTIHSYGKYFMYPYAYDGSSPPNVEELISLGNQVASTIDALAAPGSEKYVVTNSADAMKYTSPGSSGDWAMGAGGVNLSYVIELPPKSEEPGFDLPPSDIEQVVKETWGGILVLARYVMNKSI